MIKLLDNDNGDKLKKKKQPKQKDSPLHINVSDILKRLDIVQVIGLYLSLYRKPDTPFVIYAKCPFCADGEMMIVWPPQMYACQTCQSLGNAFAFVAKYKGLKQGRKYELQDVMMELSEQMFNTLPLSKDTIIIP